MAYPLFSPPGAVSVSPGSSVEVKPRVRQAGFGDGYKQRTGDGINAIVRTFDAQFTALTSAEAQTIIAFFEGRKGYLPFRWTIPGEASSRQWTAPSWRRIFGGKNVADIVVSMEENFDP